MISLDFIQHQIQQDAALKQQIQNHYNPKIQPLNGASPWQSSLKIFLEQADFDFQSIPAACFFGFDEITYFPENDREMHQFTYHLKNSAGF